MASDSDILKEAQEAYRECQERDSHNRLSFERDMRFARLEVQWPTKGPDSEELDPSFGGFDEEARLTINRLAPVIRQVVNDARQNKPAITVRPQDNDADPETAEIMTGLIRNIESASDADIAYDTAVDHAVSGGFGFFRVNLEYACDDSWDQDIVIQRVVNPLSVKGDPYSTGADSSDWNLAFVTDKLKKEAYQRDYPKAAQTDWNPEDFSEGWMVDGQIVVAEYWTRAKVQKKLIRLLNPQTGDFVGVLEEDMEKRAEELYAQGFTEEAQSRDVMSYDVKQHILNGVEVLESTDWAGKYIPIVPVYGDEIYLKDKRYFRSLIRSAIDEQRMHNYWASKITQVVALAPRVPFIGEEGSFVDGEFSWNDVNDATIPYLEHKKGSPRPSREPPASVPSGMMQMMLNSAEGIKAVTGIYDASLGARSNETSGVAIRNRQLEGDTSTFHFIDNLSRAIRHGGRILLDLIPKVYDSERVIRVLGQDGKAETVPLKQPVPVMGPDGQPQMQQGPMGPEPVTRIYDLTMGKYDLSVEAGPSYTSRREETRAELVEVIRAVPDAAPILGPMYLRSSDWPGADDAADKLEAMNAPPQPQGLPPEIQQQMQQGMELIQSQQAEIAELKEGQAEKQAEIMLKQKAAEQKDVELQIKSYEAETARMTAMQPPQVNPRGEPEAYRM